MYLVSTSSVYSNSKREKCNAPHEFKLRGRQDTAELYSAVSRIPWSQTLHWEGHWWVKLFWKKMFWTNYLLNFLLFQFLCSSMLEASCYAGHITVSQSKKFRIPLSQTLHMYDVQNSVVRRTTDTAQNQTHQIAGPLVSFKGSIK